MENQPSALIDFNKNGGVVPVVAADYRSGRLLMMAYMNRAAFDETVATKRACYFSRSRGRLWRKGEESGNFQVVHEIRLDCDNDTVFLAVEQRGDAAACHEGYESCFFASWKMVNGVSSIPARSIRPNTVQATVTISLQLLPEPLGIN